MDRLCASQWEIAVIVLRVDLNAGDDERAAALERYHTECQVLCTTGLTWQVILPCSCVTEGSSNYHGSATSRCLVPERDGP